MAGLKIAVTGATGFVGKAVVKYFRSQGATVYRLVRPHSNVEPEATDIAWDVVTQTIDLPKLEGMDAIIHLAGENIAGQRWTKAFKQKILESRVQGTTFLCGALYKLQNPPKVLISASASGYYGYHHGIEILSESAAPGTDFLAQVCQEWEQATKGAELAGIRVINLRMAAILGKESGALSKMLPIFKLGLGGPIGSGNQIFSWIALDEIPSIIDHLVRKATNIKGPINVASPFSVSNRDYTKTLGKVLKRPTAFPLPASICRVMFGEMADAILLASANLWPKKLEESGYVFKHGQLEQNLREILK